MKDSLLKHEQYAVESKMKSWLQWMLHLSIFCWLLRIAANAFCCTERVSSIKCHPRNYHLPRRSCPAFRASWIVQIIRTLHNRWPTTFTSKQLFRCSGSCLARVSHCRYLLCAPHDVMVLHLDLLFCIHFVDTWNSNWSWFCWYSRSKSEYEARVRREVAKKYKPHLADVTNLSGWDSQVVSNQQECWKGSGPCNSEGT